MNRIKPAFAALTLLGLAACSSDKPSVAELDYQSSNRKVVNLEVPPDLTNPNQGNLYQLPAGSGAVRASDINRTPAVQQAADRAVLAGVRGISLERDGSQRWLNVAGKQPAEIWPLLKAFWQESGFTIANEEPAIGQMETEWAENRAKIPNDGIRSLFEKVGLGGVYSSGERDKFIIRIEAGKNGNTDVFFAHKGMKEVYTDKNEDRSVWQPRPNDANLEAAFLGRFMQYLGADEAQVSQQLQQQASATRAQSDSFARLEKNSVIVSGNHERNRRRTALALDRIGLTVVGSNADKNAFLVQAAPSEGEAVSSGKTGLIGRMFGKKTETATAAPLELIVIAEPVGNATRISIKNRDGSSYTGKESAAWLSKLHSELR